jgi:hypothetical protein
MKSCASTGWKKTVGLIDIGITVTLFGIGLGWGGGVGGVNFLDFLGTGLCKY